MISNVFSFQFANKVLVLKTFTKAIVQNTVVSKAQSEDFALFLIEKSSELFKVGASCGHYRLKIDLFSSLKRWKLHPYF